MAVSSKLVIIKASSLSREFREKEAISQWHGLVRRMGTHISQQD